MDSVNHANSPQHPAPPPGSKEIQGGGRFLDLEPGDEVRGTYVGTTTIGDDHDLRHVIRLDRGEERVLPDHWDLREKLKQVEPGQTVWIAFLGKEPAKVKSGFMARYRVAVVPQGDRP